MKRLLSIVAVLGLTGLGMNLSAQQTPDTQTPSSQSTQSPSTQTPSTQTPSTPSDNSSMPQNQETSAANSQQSARSFEGKIQKSGDKLVLQDSASGTSYQLDDQSKAKQYEGQDVKIMGTVDSTTNTLHVVDINPASQSH